MNTRLNNAYQELILRDREKILRNEVKIDKNIGKQIQGVTLQIDLTDEVKQKIKDVQRELTSLEPNSLYLSPLEFTHISFDQVVYWNYSYKIGHEKTWNKIANEFVQRFLSLDKKFPALTITFIRLIAVTGAIIFCADDENDELEKLREHFFDVLPFPPETPKRNHFVHTSIARFINPLTNPPALFEYVTKQEFNIPMRIKAIVLRQENRYPSLAATEIARIHLI